MFNQKIWLALFVLGFPILLYQGVRWPFWAAAVAGYFYFAIPPLEFFVPNAPYQAAFWALAVAGSFRYRTLLTGQAAHQVEAAAVAAARRAMDGALAALKEALYGAAGRGLLPGEIRSHALSEAEPPAMEHTRRECPRPVHEPVRRAVQSLLSSAADVGERESLRVLENVGASTKGNLRVALEGRVGPVVDETVEKKLEPVVLEEVKKALELDEKQRKGEVKVVSGPLGAPMPRGPLTGLLANPGLWLHLVFMVLTYIGALNALFDVNKAMTRFGDQILLLIPMVAIGTALRAPEHARIFVIAWLAGTAHLCMNAITFWLQYGGRADAAGGQGGESNFLGAVINVIAPVAFGMVLNERASIGRIMGVVLSAIYVLGILASGSRAALVALVGAAGFWLFHTNRKGVAIGGSMVALACFLAVAPDDFWTRMGTIMGEKDHNPWVQTAIEPSKHERQVLWQIAVDIYKEHPLMGIGPRQYTFVSAEKTDFTDPYQGQRGLQAHNTWLQLLAEFGTLGGLVWGGAFLLSIFCYRIARRQIRDFPEMQWLAAMCLGLEAGAIGNAITAGFNSFQWYDYQYWHFIFGPVMLQVCKDARERLVWLQPMGLLTAPPPPRYGPPLGERLDLEALDVSSAAPLERPAER